MSAEATSTPEETRAACGNRSLDELVRETASDYASFIVADPEKESNHLDEKIEELLTRLDEFCAVVDIIRTDSSLALNRSLPEVHAKSQELETVFQKIDDLERFVALVKKDVVVMEEQVNTAEKDLGTMTSVKNLIMSFPLFSQVNASAMQFRIYDNYEVYKDWSMKNRLMLNDSKTEKRAKNPAHKPLRKYVPPEIYRTEDYVLPAEDQEPTGEG